LLIEELGALLSSIASYRDNINILIFGEYGSGKTSYMLTLKTAFAGRLILQDKELGRIGGGNTHSSTTFRQVRLTDKVSFWDPWGSSPTNYKDSEFKYMVAGRVPKDWEMDRALTLDNIIKDNAAANHNKPHAVFFIVSQAQVEDTEYLGRLRGWVETLSRERPGNLFYTIPSVINYFLRKN
jgi:predicted GTPase